MAFGRTSIRSIKLIQLSALYCYSSLASDKRTLAMKILLVRLRLIGDVIFTTPAIAALKQHMPDAHLVYLVEPEAAPVVTGNPNLDEVIVMPRTHGFARIRDDIRLARQLRASQFDLAIDFHGGPRSSWLVRLSGAPVRIGYQVPLRQWFYTVRTSRSRKLLPRHSVENQWDLLTTLGGSFATPPSPSVNPVEMSLDPTALTKIDQWLQQKDVFSSHRLIVIHVSSGNPFRRWPEAHFVELVVGLIKANISHRIFLTSGPSDISAAHRIIRKARLSLNDDEAAAVLDNVEFDLHQLHALIDRSALFIGGDSGPLHIASTTQTPIVGLFGATLPVRSMPWRDTENVTKIVEVSELTCRPCNQKVCEPGDFRCLTQLSTNAVLLAAKRALLRSSAL